MSIISILSPRVRVVCRRRSVRRRPHAKPTAPPKGQAHRAPRPQWKLFMPITWSRITEPRSWCSTAVREYRRPSAASLQVCSSPCAHDRCAHTRRPGARTPCSPSHVSWSPDSPHAMSRSMSPLTVSLAVESRRLTLRLKDRCSSCVQMAVDGVLLLSIKCGPRTALEPMVEVDSRVCKRRIRRPLHAAVLVLRVALSVALCARLRQVYCFIRSRRPAHAL